MDPSDSGAIAAIVIFIVVLIALGCCAFCCKWIVIGSICFCCAKLCCCQDNNAPTTSIVIHCKSSIFVMETIVFLKLWNSLPMFLCFSPQRSASAPASSSIWHEWRWGNPESLSVTLKATILYHFCMMAKICYCCCVICRLESPNVPAAKVLKGHLQVQTT